MTTTSPNHARAMPPIMPMPPAGLTAIEAAIEIRLPNGLPGFPAETEYALEPVAETAQRFFRLRSVRACGPVFLLAADPTPGRLLERRELLEACETAAFDAEDVMVLFIVAATSGPAGLALFVNRRAPILIDQRRRVARQVVLSRADYAVRHPLGRFTPRG
jgi:flagellar assembly factor FliW